MALVHPLLPGDQGESLSLRPLPLLLAATLLLAGLRCALPWRLPRFAPALSATPAAAIPWEREPLLLDLRLQRAGSWRNQVAFDEERWDDGLRAVLLAGGLGRPLVLVAEPLAEPRLEQVALRLRRELPGCTVLLLAGGEPALPDAWRRP